MQYWEAGGISNTAIAAARLGLDCIAIGQVGDEIYGNFLLDVLHDEGIEMVGMVEHDGVIGSSSTSCETHICYVLVNPLQEHAFCSPSDFVNKPALSWMTSLSTKVKMAIKQSKILFCDGFAFFVLQPDLIISALEYATEVGRSIFFDPGPRGKYLANGTPAEQKALDKLLTMSNVLILTSDEAEALTSIRDPILAGMELLRKGICTEWIIVKMGSKGSILITESSVSFAPAFKVDVIDTVGCGDSFGAAIAFGYIHSLPLLHTLTLANAVGGATAMSSGAGRAVATLEKVIEIMTRSQINEDDFIHELLNKDLNVQEITVISNMTNNGNSNKPKHVPLQKVTSELLLKFDPDRIKYSGTIG
ncbi:fructokinase-1 isoform X2 [Daucus carota subsp. sativus]|uniref:fructokinase-1 isoform X2 n=1 Tax=Daucus carota subsp. sativus TaxID=79200 RepID=UPI0007EF9DAE|nr:PREDICTED: fructokinase-1-like isoform X2 [Daucus carota subsp. sativus]XP_017231713.1 PREDICTED: fructokinase-1-like isoform X2 [Daucus carota subsp. sativus]